MSKKLPQITSDIPRDLRVFTDRLREMLSSDNTDRFVTARELTSIGVVQTDRRGILVNPGTPITVSKPSRPVGFTVTAAIENILIEWDAPQYSGHAYAEVWGHSTDDINSAVKVGVAPGNVFIDAVGPSVSRYYWVRFVNTDTVPGPFNSATGTLGETGPAVAHLLETLTDAALDPDSPYTKFAVRADLFFVAPEMDFNQEATPTALATGDLWYKPSTEVTKVWNGSTWASFDTTLPFIVNTSAQTINGVAVPAGVYMDAAFIKNGTITNAKIGNAAIDDAKIANLSASKITAGTIAADRLTSTVINAKVTNIDAAVIGSGTINSARIGDLSADKITSGTLDADRIGSGTATVASGQTFSLGAGSSAFGYTAAGVFSSSSSTASGLIAATTNSTYGIAGIGYGSGVNGVGGVFGRARTSAFSSWRSIVNNGEYTAAIVCSYLGSSGDAKVSAIIAHQTNGSGSYYGGVFINTVNDTGGYVGISGYDFYAFGNGTNYGPFTGAHDALLDKSYTLEAGDIVADTGFAIKSGISNTITKVVPCSSANQAGVLGVFVSVCNDHAPVSLSDKVEGILAVKPEYESLLVDNNIIMVNAVGEGQINVCGQGGDIQLGDLLTSSTIVGKAMKQADDLVHSYTVAKARETVTFSSPTEVKQIACIYMCG